MQYSEIRVELKINTGLSLSKISFSNVCFTTVRNWHSKPCKVAIEIVWNKN